MVSKKTLDTMKWWYETDRKPAEYFREQVIVGKITQSEADEILGV